MKNRLKTVLAVLIATAASTPALTQGSYAGIGVTYGIPVAGAIVGENIESNQPAGTESDETVRGSLGRGLSVGAYFGYMPNENMGFELGVNYLFGMKYKFTDNRVLSSNVTDNTSTEINAHSLRLVPAVRFTFGEGSIRPYMRGGVVIGLMNKVTVVTHETFSNPSVTDVTESTFEYYHGAAFGIAGGLGANFSISDNLFFSAEITNYFYSWSPAKGHYTKFTVDGADQLGGMTTNEKEIEYVDKVDQSMNTSDSQPYKAPRFSLPMSSIGLQVGIHFAF